jgi:maltose alpha-D-glucosyltransferase/alpha-amylase
MDRGGASGESPSPEGAPIGALIAKADTSRLVMGPAPLTGALGLTLTQIHGSLDLAHVLIYETDVTFIGPAGDGTEPPEARRRLRSPLEDVAVMLRSFHTAAAVAFEGNATLPAHQRDAVAAWTRCWTAWNGAAFLAAYRRAAGDAAWLPRDPADVIALLRLWLFRQACDDIAASLDARPAWLRLSLALADDLLDGADAAPVESPPTSPNDQP